MVVGADKRLAGCVSFTAVGQPQPAGSKRAFRHSVTGRVMVADANRKSKPWQAVVASAGADAMPDAGGLFDGPLAVTMIFYLPRPRGHYRTGRNSHMLRPAAPLYPATRPDVLKLARGVEDALTGVCWRDDALIVAESLEKRYGTPARVEVLIDPVSRSWEASAA